MIDRKLTFAKQAVTEAKPGLLSAVLTSSMKDTAAPRVWKLTKPASMVTISSVKRESAARFAHLFQYMGPCPRAWKSHSYVHEVRAVLQL